ncbi:hypothetical protein TL16_g08031 [Triparma laevis f. inornata]|uniref:Uncharacterized protein n=1 Tax=Triparma laevis f. inornata TaxID=1714386 RepID=A0A9W7B207_9STRA|nr:hypothetical protein TL16_g08031 [Triparma laevis f. inornata]
MRATDAPKTILILLTFFFVLSSSRIPLASLSTSSVPSSSSKLNFTPKRWGNRLQRYLTQVSYSGREDMGKIRGGEREGEKEERWESSTYEKSNYASTSPLPSPPPTSSEPSSSSSKTPSEHPLKTSKYSLRYSTTSPPPPITTPTLSTLHFSPSGTLYDSTSTPIGTWSFPPPETP